MNVIRFQTLVLAIVASVFTVANRVHADEPMPSSKPTAPSDEFRDSAFEPFIDIHLVGPAITDLDAVLLTDLALQLSEGERVLLRQHKSGVTAQSLLAKAALLAANKQDKATLERLMKMAGTLGNKELSAQLAALEKVGGVSRAADAAFTVSLDAVTIETVVRLKGILDAIKQAELIGDREWLDAVEQELKDAPDITDAQTTALAKLIENARDGMPQEGTVEPDPIAKLAGASRQHWLSRPQDWGSTGIQIFPRREESVSTIQSVAPPHIDRDGQIWSGSGSGGGSGRVVGRAKLQFDASGAAYWHSNYANGYGRVQSPVRAFAKYDRVTKANQLGQSKAGRPTSGGPSKEVQDWLRSLSPKEREAFLKNGYVRPSPARPSP